MNKNSIWRWILATVIIGVGIFYALPNWYGVVPAVQIAPRSGEMPVEIDQKLTSAFAGMEGVGEVDVQPDFVLIRARSDKAQDAIRNKAVEILGPEYLVSLNLVSNSPSWVDKFVKPMAQGLDLRGGVHFLMEVDLEKTTETLNRKLRDEARDQLRSNDLSYDNIKVQGPELVATFETEPQRDAAKARFDGFMKTVVWRDASSDSNYQLNGVLTDEAIAQESFEAVQANITTLRNRVNELGVSEPVIQQQGFNRVVVQLPGIQDVARAKKILGATATLEYRLVFGGASEAFEAAQSGVVPLGAELYTERDTGQPILLNSSIIVTGDEITGATSGIDSQSNSPAVFVTLNSKGAKRMARITAKNVGEPMAVLYKETRTIQVFENEKLHDREEDIQEVINVATIRDVLSNTFQTTGLDSVEAQDIALLLRAGALRAPMKIIEERTIGPSLGEENIASGLLAVQIGMAAVLAFMLMYYKVFGLFANMALTSNLVLMVAVMSMLQAVLTMPGIAGMVLTVGMAVDANVLIFERIKEELRAGSDSQTAIKEGYDKALSTIADANITTFIAALVLYLFGTGPIKGFAVTLSIGILTSMLTAILGTRLLANAVYGGRENAKLKI